MESLKRCGNEITFVSLYTDLYHIANLKNHRNVIMMLSRISIGFILGAILVFQLSREQDDEGGEDAAADGAAEGGDGAGGDESGDSKGNNTDGEI
ncbi:hypothetical protein HHI36_014376 [Cryptolaemus montrouzieri]|uniref:Uncharacterized protein n=1 Tax=Cryptolaemus montrouzieri TaxID=559131 RepID=A0ABD2N342_9CUCU